MLIHPFNVSGISLCFIPLGVCHTVEELPGKLPCSLSGGGAIPRCLSGCDSSRCLPSCSLRWRGGIVLLRLCCGWCCGSRSGEQFSPQIQRLQRKFEIAR